MYAVIETGGKQYNVSEGDLLRIEKLDKAVGDVVDDFKVLMIANELGIEVGNPYIVGAKVVAEVVEQGKARKLRIFKYKPKKNERKRMGHSQPFTAIRITSIGA